MTRLDRWLLHLAVILTGATGLLYGWARYFGQRAGEFGPEPPPWQAQVQHLHLLASPVLVFALGLLLRSHALAKLRSGLPTGRRSGWLLLGAAAPMVLAGYGVQVAVEPTFRTFLAWVHGVPSLLFLGGWLVHLARARWAKPRTEENGLPGLDPGPVDGGRADGSQ